MTAAVTLDFSAVVDPEWLDVDIHDTDIFDAEVSAHVLAVLSLRDADLIARRTRRDIARRIRERGLVVAADQLATMIEVDSL
jgi:hypothetical protein